MSDEQLELWRVLRDRGIEVSYDNASAVWRAEAEAAAQRAARLLPMITTTDVYDLMDPQVRDLAKGQAFAGVMFRVAKTGAIEKTEPAEYRNHRRPRNHGREQRLWRSLVFRPTRPPERKGTGRGRPG